MLDDYIKDKIIAGTGHRPKKLGGYAGWEKVQEVLVQRMDSAFRRARPKLVLTGMAQGWDTVLAHAAIRSDTPFAAVMPYPDYGMQWPFPAQNDRDEILARSVDVLYVQDDYTKDVLDKRNRFLVHGCQLLIAAWDGSPSGTANCIEYAESINRPTVNIFKYITKGLL